MKVPSEYVLYNCGGKFFGSYNMAYYYYKKCKKPIYYVLTLNNTGYRKVSDIEKAYFNIMHTRYDCDYIDFKNKTIVKQNKLF